MLLITSLNISYDRLNISVLSPKSIALNRSGIDRARKFAYLIRSTISEGLYTEEWLKAEVYQQKVKPIILTWGLVADAGESLWLRSRGGSGTTDRQKERTLSGYRSQIKLAGAINTALSSYVEYTIVIERLTQ